MPTPGLPLWNTTSIEHTCSTCFLCSHTHTHMHTQPIYKRMRAETLFAAPCVLMSTIKTMYYIQANNVIHELILRKIAILHAATYENEYNAWKFSLSALALPTT